MTTVRSIGLALSSVAAATVLAACSSSTSGAPGTSGTVAAPSTSATPTTPSTSASSSSASTSAATSASSPATAGAFPRDPAALGALLKAGTASLTSAHIDYRVSTNGQVVRSVGDETLAGGQVKNSSLVVDAGNAGTTKIISVGGKAYVALPATQRTSAKPWSLVSSTSKNQYVRIYASSLRSTTTGTGVDSSAVFVAATDKLELLNTETLDGVQVEHYRATVVTAKLPSTFPQRAALQSAGIDSLPVELWVDHQGRSHKAAVKIKIGSATADSVVTLNKFNQPVHISAPPARLISTD